LSGGYRENVPEGVRFIEGSIIDAPLLEKLFSGNRFTHVYHLAAYAAEGLSHFIRRFNYTNNIIGSVNLINESVKHDIEVFVFTSSIAVYGTNQLPMREDMMPNPEDPYGIAKYAVERDLHASQQMFGLNYVIFRPHNVYGEKQNIADKYRNVIGIFMNAVLHDRPMPIFGDGEQTRAFSYIGDVAPTIAQCIERPECFNEIFNVGADKYYSINQLAEIVASAMDVTARSQHVEARNEVVDAYSDHAKIEKFFGKNETVSLEDGIKRMADWVKRHGPRKSQEFGDIEIFKNLPPSWLKRDA
jgi:UDP-glucose 4-epimerase